VTGAFLNLVRRIEWTLLLDNYKALGPEAFDICLKREIIRVGLPNSTFATWEHLDWDALAYRVCRESVISELAAAIELGMKRD